MKRLGRALGRLTLQHWGWLHFKFSIGLVFPLMTLWSVPATVNSNVNRFLVLTWLGLTVAGALISMTGIILSAQGGKCRVLSVSIEMVGLIFMFLGPFLLFLMYTYFAVTGLEFRPTAIGLTWGLCSAMIARFLMVLPRYLREAHDETKET